MKAKEEKTPNKFGHLKDHIPEDLQELEHDELSGHEQKELDLETSSTDDDEDEGVGDGNIGRSHRDVLGK